MKIDESYYRCEKPREMFFDYAKAKQSASHVYLLLNGALAKMIDAAKYFIFVGTTNSCIETGKTASLTSILTGEYSTFSLWMIFERCGNYTNPRLSTPNNLYSLCGNK